MMGKTRNLGKTLVCPPFRGGPGSKGNLGRQPIESGEVERLPPLPSMSDTCMAYSGRVLGPQGERELPASP